MIAHLRRELMHAIRLVLLDEEFIEAYVHGILHKFINGIVRRAFLRIFTYSADYPEKFAAFFLYCKWLTRLTEYCSHASGSLRNALAQHAWC